jgi:hypothetical protein
LNLKKRQRSATLHSKVEEDVLGLHRRELFAHVVLLLLLRRGRGIVFLPASLRRLLVVLLLLATTVLLSAVLLLLLGLLLVLPAVLRRLLHRGRGVRGRLKVLGLLRLIAALRGLYGAGGGVRRLSCVVRHLQRRKEGEGGEGKLCLVRK